MLAYFLRPAIESERARIFETYRETVGPYIAQAWGWDDDYQLGSFWKHHPFGEFQTIRVGDSMAGGLHLEQDSADLFIRMLFLAPEFQGRGIGTKLVGDLHSVAQDSGKGLSLKVIRTNPARRLYERLGFLVSNEDDSSLDMRWA